MGSPLLPLPLFLDVESPQTKMDGVAPEVATGASWARAWSRAKVEKAIAEARQRRWGFMGEMGAWSRLVGKDLSQAITAIEDEAILRGFFLALPRAGVLA
jgi:hypothetical protein